MVEKPRGVCKEMIRRNEMAGSYVLSVGTTFNPEPVAPIMTRFSAITQTIF